MFFQSNNKSSLLKALLCGASLGVIAVATSGQAFGQAAQQAAKDNTDVEAVTVTATGTSIKGIAPVGTNLITVDAATIKATGAVTTEEIFNQIPQLANTFNTQTVSPTAINIGGVRPSIRYNPAQTILGNSSTLLLLDGHNMVGVSGLATTPDAGVIPTIVLRQVDVLPDGASSIYGANAIAGVLNFVTLDSFQGIRSNASVGVANGYSSFNASFMAGTDWGSGGIYGAFEHKDNTYLMANARSYTKMDLSGIGGRDSRGTSCDLANITIGANNYALKSNTVANTPGALAAAVTGPFGALNSGCRPVQQQHPLQPLRHQFLRLAVSQGRAEFLLRPVPSESHGRRQFLDEIPLDHAPGFAFDARVERHQCHDRQYQSLFPVDQRRNQPEYLLRFRSLFQQPELYRHQQYPGVRDSRPS